MKNEKILVSRDDAAINALKKSLADQLPKYHQLVRMYLSLKLDAHSRAIPLIVRNALNEVREQVVRNLPPSLRNNKKDVEEQKLPGEDAFFAFLGTLKKEGILDNQDYFTITGLGDVEINQAKLQQFETEHTISVAEVKALELLEKVVASLDEWEKYSRRTYLSGANLVLPVHGESVCLNPRWHLANRDQQGNLTLNLEMLKIFEANRVK